MSWDILKWQSACRACDSTLGLSLVLQKQKPKTKITEKDLNSILLQNTYNRYIRQKANMKKYKQHQKVARKQTIVK